MNTNTTPAPSAETDGSPNGDFTVTMSGVQVAAQILRSAGHELAAVRCENLINDAEGLLAVTKMAYRKHHLGDDNIGWNELADRLCDALCNAMGDVRFQQWLSENLP